MAHAKDTHYWTQLHTALVGGKWESHSPGHAPNGTPLSWSELLRKFKKHCGYEEFAEVVTQTQALALFLTSSANLSATDLDGDGESENEPLTLGHECILDEERQEEAHLCYSALKTLPDTSSENESIKLALAYFAYTLDQPAECLSYLAGLRLSDRPSTKPKDDSHTEKPQGSSIADIKHDSAWTATERIRGLCLQGMSHEKISPNYPKEALLSYLAGLEVLRPLNIPKSPPTSSGKANWDSFILYRELWRWTERLIWRAIIVSSSTRSIDFTRSLFRLYTQYSAHWPATFRPSHRSTISCLNLLALVLVRPDPKTASASDKHLWLAEARAAILDYQAVLSASTQFPRAGQRNSKVEEFVDLCVAVWEAGGAVGDQAGWVIEIMWWATRLTFNCPRIFRHMTRLLHVSGDTALAKRTLRLYVQVTMKRKSGAKAELAGADSDKQWVETLIQGARMLCRIPGGVEEVREARKLIDRAKECLDRHDKELCASVDLAEGVCESVLALREQEPLTRSTRLTASLNCFLRSVEHAPTPSACYHLALALSRPGPSRDLQQAIAHARSAVEGDAKEIRYWHLLGLLLVASGDWKAARSVLELGAELQEDIESEIQEEQQQEKATNGLVIRDFAAGIIAAEIDDEKGAPTLEDPTQTPVPACLLEKGATQIPPAASFQQSLPDHPPPSLREMFEYGLQLRMTQLALAEFVEGADSAGAKWTEVFAWFGDRRATGAERRASIDGRPSTEAQHSIHMQSQHQPEKQPMPEPVPEQQLADPQNGTGLVEDNHTLSLARSISPPIESPVPIMITPASPLVGPETSPMDNAMTSSKDILVGMSSEVQGIRRERSTGKRVQKMFKNRVHEGQKRISTISKKIGSVRTGNGNLMLRRTNSAPDFHAVLAQARPYQASSIHSRKRIVGSWGSTPRRELSPIPSPPPPPLPSLQSASKPNDRTATERRLLSDLWLMSASSFRRVGKIEQARAAIQEAEVLDEENEAVWVQLGLYFEALGDESQAIEAFHKALFIAPDDVPAVIHLCRQYLSSSETASPEQAHSAIDLAAGMLSDLTRGGGWDVPEAWYFLAKAMGLQGRKERERECLCFALGLVEARGVRDINTALGFCI